MEAINQRSHPGDFASDVDVVGTVRNAGLDQPVAVELKRAGHREQYMCSGNEIAGLLGIAGVRDHERYSCAECLKSVAIPPCCGPTEPRLCVSLQVHDSLLSSEARRAVEDEVKLALAHAETLSGNSGGVSPQLDPLGERSGLDAIQETATAREACNLFQSQVNRESFAATAPPLHH